MVQKAVAFLLLADNGIWWYAEFKSNTETTLALENVPQACLREGIGKASKTTFLFNRRQSTTIR
jgi:hypothetical protein